MLRHGLNGKFGEAALQRWGGRDKHQWALRPCARTAIKVQSSRSNRPFSGSNLS